MKNIFTITAIIMGVLVSSTGGAVDKPVDDDSSIECSGLLENSFDSNLKLLNQLSKFSKELRRLDEDDWKKFIAMALTSVLIQYPKLANIDIINLKVKNKPERRSWIEQAKRRYGTHLIVYQVDVPEPFIISKLPKNKDL